MRRPFAFDKDSQALLVISTVVVIPIVAAIVEIRVVAFVLIAVQQPGALRTSAASALARDVIETGLAREIAVRRTRYPSGRSPPPKPSNAFDAGPPP